MSLKTKQRQRLRYRSASPSQFSGCLRSAQVFSVSLSDPFIWAKGCVLFLAFMLMTEGGRLVTHMFNSTVNILSFSIPRILPLYSLTLVYLSPSFLPPLNQYRSAIMHESSQASPLNQSRRPLYVAAVEHCASVLYLYAFPRNHLDVFLDIVFISAARSAARENWEIIFHLCLTQLSLAFFSANKCIFYRHFALFGVIGLLKCQVFLNVTHTLCPSEKRHNRGEKFTKKHEFKAFLHVALY